MRDSITVLYFAVFAEKLNCKEEVLSLSGIKHGHFASTELLSVADIKQFLSLRGGVWSSIFAGEQQVFSAVNYERVKDEHLLLAGSELAFFPPVTGG